MKQDTPFDVSSEIVMRKISEIKPYVRNPRKNTKTVDLLVEIIPKVGFNVPIVIDNKGIIVKGHARYCAAIRLGMKEVPCVITEADEETIKLDRLTDNRISEFSEWIDEELLHELDSLNLDYDLDFESFGFELTDFDIPEEDSFEAEDGESDEDRRHRYEEYLDVQEGAERHRNCFPSPDRQGKRSQAGNSSSSSEVLQGRMRTLRAHYVHQGGQRRSCR